MRAIMRLIDWNRGSPYTFTMKEKAELLNSEYLFCRKFDEKVDLDIINFFKEHIVDSNMRGGITANFD